MTENRENRNHCKLQITRMAGMPYFPVVDQAIKELIDTLLECSTSEAHMKAVVDEAVRADRCPTPGELRRIANEKKPPAPSDHARCQRCKGLGFVFRDIGGYTGAAPCPGGSERIRS